MTKTSKFEDLKLSWRCCYGSKIKRVESTIKSMKSQPKRTPTFFIYDNKNRITYDLCMYRIRYMNLSLSKTSNLIKEKKKQWHFNPIRKESNSI